MNKGAGKLKQKKIGYIKKRKNEKKNVQNSNRKEGIKNIITKPTKTQKYNLITIATTITIIETYFKK